MNSNIHTRRGLVERREAQGLVRGLVVRLVFAAFAGIALTACPAGGGGPDLSFLAFMGGPIGEPIVIDPVPTPTFTVGGMVSGLSGGQEVKLKSGDEELTITQNGSFTFATEIASGTAYNVQVESTTAAACTASSNTGVIAAQNVVDISIICGTPRILSVQLTDLDAAGSLGSGLTFQNNGSSVLTGFTGFGAPNKRDFAVQVVEGAQYNVAVTTQPGAPNQVCSPVTAADASGTMPASAHTVTFGCSTSFYTVRASVTGLAGTGLRLRNNNNGADELTPSIDGTFDFTVKVTAGLAYAVTVQQQPSNLNQTCAVTGGGNGDGSGTITADTTVTVTCQTNPYAVSGTISGLSGGDAVTLQINGGNNMVITNPTTAFAFPGLPDGTAYTVTVLSKPANKGCYVTNAGGTLAGAAVNNVSVTCGTCIGGGGNKSINVSWTASRSYDVNTAAGGGHKIYYDTLTGISKTTTNVVTVPNTTSATSGSITGLWPGCTYFIKVGAYSAINSAGGTLSGETSVAIPQ